MKGYAETTKGELRGGSHSDAAHSGRNISTVILLVGAQMGVAILPASAVKHSLRQSSPVTQNSRQI